MKTDTLPQLSRQEIKQNRKHLKGGSGAIVAALADVNGGESPIKESQVRNILSGLSEDLHGVLEIASAIIHKEKKRKADLANGVAA